MPFCFAGTQNGPGFGKIINPFACLKMRNRYRASLTLSDLGALLSVARISVSQSFAQMIYNAPFCSVSSARASTIRLDTAY